MRDGSSGDGEAHRDRQERRDDERVEHPEIAGEVRHRARHHAGEEEGDENLLRRGPDAAKERTDHAPADAGSPRGHDEPCGGVARRRSLRVPPPAEQAESLGQHHVAEPGGEHGRRHGVGDAGGEQERRDDVDEGEQRLPGQEFAQQFVSNGIAVVIPGQHRRPFL